MPRAQHRDDAGGSRRADIGRFHGQPVRGRLVAKLVDELRPAGYHAVVWDGTDNLGSAAASGIYFYEARTAGEVRVGKMTLVK